MSDIAATGPDFIGFSGSFVRFSILALLIAATLSAVTVRAARIEVPVPSLAGLRLRLKLDTPPHLPVKPTPAVFVKEQAMSPHTLLHRWDKAVKAASKRFGVPVAWIRAVMRRESGGRTVGPDNRPLTSAAGAVGLMQLQPDTFAEMSAQYGLGDDPADPHDNIFAGAAYLRWLKGKFGFPGMFAAYNTGPGNYAAYLHGQHKLPAETVAYLAAMKSRLGHGHQGRAGHRVRVALD